MNKIPFHFQILIGMVAGALFGLFLPSLVGWVAPLGTLFIRLLKMIVIPLIFISVMNGIVRVGNTRKLSQLGLGTTSYYLATNCFAVLTALVLVNIIRPGAGVKVFGDQGPAVTKSITIWDLVPANIFEAFTPAGSALQIIFLAILFGVAMVALGTRVAKLAEGLDQANNLLMQVTGYLIRLAPIGVFALIANMIGGLNPEDFQGIGKFALTIILGLLVHGVIVIPVIFKLFSSRSLRGFFKSAQPALLAAFSTSSSSATLPITMRCVDEGAKIPKEISRFVLPVGATVNMDGTAIYEATACLFVAQAVGVDLSLMQQIVVFFTASLAAIGAASIPSAGLVTLTMVLSSVGLPLEGIGLLLAIDRPLDMSRTTVNVWGDMVGCAVVENKKD